MIKAIIVVFLVAITLGSYLLLRKKSGQDLMLGYLLSITSKIVLSCGFVIAFILLDRPNADYNAVFFLVGYVIFTAAEVIFLLLKSKPKKIS
ncbi:MAG: hypothetical protein WDO14_12265 [Bacteroidota bacterium]